MAEPRLAASVAIGALLRAAAEQGDFATVLHKGDATSGTILIVHLTRGQTPMVYQRFTDAYGTAKWEKLLAGTAVDEQAVDAYLKQRTAQDPDLWVIELDTAEEQRLIRLIEIVA